MGGVLWRYGYCGRTFVIGSLWACCCVDDGSGRGAWSTKSSSLFVQHTIREHIHFKGSAVIEAACVADVTAETVVEVLIITFVLVSRAGERGG